MHDEFVRIQYRRYCDIVEDAICKKNIKRALAALSICCELQYQWNQVYADIKLEKYIQTIADLTRPEWLDNLEVNEESILFYDGFGYDTRGLALIYLKALKETGLDVVYVTHVQHKNKQPTIDKIICGSKIKREFIKNSFDRAVNLKELHAIIKRHKSGKAFFLSTPIDTAGVACFSQLKDKVMRFQINLTDHAFWLGSTAFDYCIEFRNYGAGISLNERGIDFNKLILLPFYPYINKEQPFLGFDFDIDGKKILFSGGTLYKTIDKKLTYYSMVSSILLQVPDVVFVYAGAGNSKYIEELRQKFSGRVFHIEERPDLYQLMQHVTLYLSTYPVTGGLMTQYSVAAGKIPVTLVFDSISDDFLINQKTRGIEYYTANDLIEDVVRLLNERDYLKKREEMLKGALIDEAEFNEQLRSIVLYQKTKYVADPKMPKVNNLHNSYRENFDKQKFLNVIIKSNNIALFPELKQLYVKKVFRKLFNK